MFHIFAFLQSDMVLRIINNFLWIFNASLSENSYPSSMNLASGAGGLWAHNAIVVEKDKRLRWIPAHKCPFWIRSFLRIRFLEVWLLFNKKFLRDLLTSEWHLSGKVHVCWFDKKPDNHNNCKIELLMREIHLNCRFYNVLQVKWVERNCARFQLTKQTDVQPISFRKVVLKRKFRGTSASFLVLNC